MYRTIREVLSLIGLSIAENFGYRQLTVLWRLKGLLSAARRDTTWGQMTRRGFGPDIPLPEKEPRSDARAA